MGSAYRPKLKFRQACTSVSCVTQSCRLGSAGWAAGIVKGKASAFFDGEMRVNARPDPGSESALTLLLDFDLHVDFNLSFDLRLQFNDCGPQRIVNANFLTNDFECDGERIACRRVRVTAPP